MSEHERSAVEARVMAWVRFTLRRLGISQKKMAQHLGVHEARISNTVKGYRAFNVTVTAKFCQQYGLDPARVLFTDPPLEEPPDPKKTEPERRLAALKAHLKAQQAATDALVAERAQRKKR